MMIIRGSLIKGLFIKAPRELKGEHQGQSRVTLSQKNEGEKNEGRGNGSSIGSWRN